MLKSRVEFLHMTNWRVESALLAGLSNTTDFKTRFGGTRFVLFKTLELLRKLTDFRSRITNL